MSDKWISVKEKVPDHSHRVVVTIYNFHIDIRYLGVGRYVPEEHRWNIPHDAGRVIAWQEGPEPYNEETDELEDNDPIKRVVVNGNSVEIELLDIGTYEINEHGLYLHGKDGKTTVIWEDSL